MTKDTFLEKQDNELNGEEYSGENEMERKQERKLKENKQLKISLKQWKIVTFYKSCNIYITGILFHYHYFRHLKEGKCKKFKTKVLADNDYQVLNEMRKREKINKSKEETSSHKKGK